MKTIIQIDGMHCASCAMSIDDTLEQLDGVRRAKTSYARGLVKVDHDPDRVDGQQLREAITQAGYRPRAPWHARLARAKRGAWRVRSVVLGIAPSRSARRRRSSQASSWRHPPARYARSVAAPGALAAAV